MISSNHLLHHITNKNWSQANINYSCPAGTYRTDGVSCRPCPFATWTTTAGQTACDTTFSFSYTAESATQQLYIPFGVKMINVKLWGAGGASGNGSRDQEIDNDRNCIRHPANTHAYDGSYTLTDEPKYSLSSTIMDSCTSMTYHAGKGGDYFSSNISVSTNQNVWIVVGKGGYSAAHTTGPSDVQMRGTG